MYKRQRLHRVTINTRQGINAGSCFRTGLHRLKSGAPPTAFHNHIKKTPARVTYAGNCFGTGLHCLKMGLLLVTFIITRKKAPASVLYHHSEKSEKIKKVWGESYEKKEQRSFKTLSNFILCKRGNNCTYSYCFGHFIDCRNLYVIFRQRQGKGVGRCV